MPRPAGGRALFWLTVTACVFAAGAAFAALLALRGAQLAEMDSRSAVIVRVLAPDDAAAVARAAEIAQQTQGVVSAEAMSPARAATLLRQFGMAPPEEPLPALRLVEVETDGSSATPGALADNLLGAGLQAELIRGPSSSVAQRATANVRVAAFGGAGAALLAAAFIVTFAGAARGASGAATMAQGLVDLGATRGQVMGVFGGEAASAGFIAGLTAAATVVAGLVALRLHGPDPALALLIARMTPIEYAPLAAAPVVAALLGGLGARAAADAAFTRAAVKP
ncbi:MAG: hypothetical protein KJS97_09735 [Alphaproteobacteria bacterium]|nr:hypothetical protein [Alphaproteobacteria bacterium]